MANIGNLMTRLEKLEGQVIADEEMIDLSEFGMEGAKITSAAFRSILAEISAAARLDGL